MSTAVPILGMITLLCKLIVAIYSSMAIYFNYMYMYIYVPLYVIIIWVTYIYDIMVVESERW